MTLKRLTQALVLGTALAGSSLAERIALLGPEGTATNVDLSEQVQVKDNQEYLGEKSPYQIAVEIYGGQIVPGTEFTLFTGDSATGVRKLGEARFEGITPTKWGHNSKFADYIRKRMGNKAITPEGNIVFSIHYSDRPKTEVRGFDEMLGASTIGTYARETTLK